MSNFSIEKERSALQDIAKDYGDASPFDVRMRGYMMRSLEPYFVSGGRCLQLGCAQGDQTVILARRFDHVDVIEAVGDFIEMTKDRAHQEGIDNISYHHGMVEEFKTDQRYDTIILSHVLEHIHDDVGVLKILINHLTEKGRIFVIVPNANAASRLVAVKMGILNNTESLSEADNLAGHRRMYHLDKLCDVMRRAGGNIINNSGIFFKPLANFQFDALAGGEYISEDFMEGCYQLGKEYPTLCASIFVIAEKG